MNKNELVGDVATTREEDILTCLETVYWTLGTLCDYWAEGTQAQFDEFVAGGGFWEIPSLDESPAQFGELLKFMRDKFRA